MDAMEADGGVPAGAPCADASAQYALPAGVPASAALPRYFCVSVSPSSAALWSTHERSETVFLLQDAC